MKRLNFIRLKNSLIFTANCESLWKGKKYPKGKKSLRLGRDFAVPNSRELLWQDSSEKSADMLFNALAEFSEKSKISFLVNYHSVEEEEIMGEKKPVITKCKENFFSKSGQIPEKNAQIPDYVLTCAAFLFIIKK